jgi:predicted anti-sigma-YlaC factor YlaD
VANKFCEFARAGFSDHHDGQELPLTQRLTVGLHLAICPACRRFNRSFTATRDALSLLKDSPVAGEQTGEDKAVPK